VANADGVPEGTRTDRVTPNPAGIPQPDPPEGGPNNNPDAPDPADLAPGFGGTSQTHPEEEGGS
jgi:hypothetical protein